MTEWVDIEGYEGIYQITRTGKVRSLDKVVKCYPDTKRTVKGRTLKNRLGKVGYYYLQLSDCKNVVKNKYLHRLLCLTFILNPNNYPCVNHKDGSRTNNDLDNLEWCTHHQNMTHAAVRGQFSAKLKDFQVVVIKKRLSRGERVIDIARDYPVCPEAISRIKAGKNWKHIEI